MTAAVANASLIQALDDMSQPMSQAGSPASPTASLQNQQLQISLAPGSYHTNGHSNSGSSTQPGTPTSLQTNVSLDPPPGMSYADFLRTWSDNHVARWLTELKCPQHANTFKTNDIRGDVLLELDQMTLKEMGLVSVGDRIRIISGVKALRQKCSSVSTPLSSIVNRPRLMDHGAGVNGDMGYGSAARGAPSRRLDNGRPAPLHITPSAGSGDLPRLVRDGQDSARSNIPTVIRPLPQPTPQASSASSSVSTPSTSHTPSRANLPPLPPPPRGQPPQPPNARTPRTLVPPSLITGRRTPTLPEPTAPAFTNQPLPPAPNHLTPTSQPQGVNWPTYDPRSASSGGRTPARSPSPLPPQPTPPNRNYAHSPNSAAHGRNLSYSGSTTPSRSNESPTKLPPRPATGNSAHPYAQGNIQSALSPIHEGFTSQRANSSTPPPASATNYRGGPFLRPTTPSHNPSLDDLRRKLIKFSLPDEGKSTTINAIDCAGGPEVLERALRKFGKLGTNREDTSMQVEIINGGLAVDGWAAFLDWGQEDATGKLISIVKVNHSP